VIDPATAMLDSCRNKPRRKSESRDPHRRSFTRAPDGPTFSALLRGFRAFRVRKSLNSYQGAAARPTAAASRSQGRFAAAPSLGGAGGQTPAGGGRLRRPAPSVGCPAAPTPRAGACERVAPTRGSGLADGLLLRRRRARALALINGCTEGKGKSRPPSATSTRPPDLRHHRPARRPDRRNFSAPQGRANFATYQQPHNRRLSDFADPTLVRPLRPDPTRHRPIMKLPPHINFWLNQAVFSHCVDGTR